jgi:hypothetical protein
MERLINSNYWYFFLVTPLLGITVFFYSYDGFMKETKMTEFYLTKTTFCF